MDDYPVAIALTVVTELKLPLSFMGMLVPSHHKQQNKTRKWFDFYSECQGIVYRYPLRF